MIRDYLDIDRHWGILAYYDALPADFSQLAPILREFGCPEPEIEKAWRTIHEADKAFVFTAPWARMSVMVVGRVTHPAQFLNSLLHEFDHLQDDILEYYGVPHGTEDAAYLQGYMGQVAYDGVMPMLCGGCERGALR